MDYRLSTMKAVMNGKQNKKGFKAMEDKTIKEQEIDKTILHCKQKLDVSYYKYGPAGKNFGGGRVDALGSLDKCLIRFNRTKNTEYLEDAINYLLLRILFPMPGGPLHADGFRRISRSRWSANKHGITRLRQLLPTLLGACL